MADLTNPTFWIPIVVAGFALLAAVYYGVKGTRAKDPRYRMNSNNIVKDFTNVVQSVQMLHSGKPISNLTVTKILFWNAGRETIRANDITPVDPLRVSAVNGSEILEFTLLKENNPPSQFRIVRKDEQNITLGFDFLDRNQGAIIQVFHTGKKDQDIVLEGTVIGGHKPKLMQTRPTFYRKRGHRGIPSLAIALGGLALVVLAIFGSAYALYSLNSRPSTALSTVGSTVSSTAPEAGGIALVLILGLTYGGMGAALVYAYFRDNIPQGLEEFREKD